MKTIVFSSFKGGVGKTTLALLTANTLASAGYRILIIDLDHQGNSTQYHVPDMHEIAERNIHEVLIRERIMEYTIPSHIPNISIIASSYNIHNLRAMNPRMLPNILTNSACAENYDVCVIDCPPSLDNIILGAWMASNIIITPARIDRWDAMGLQAFRDAIQREAPDKLESWKVVLNFMRRTNSELESAFRQRYAEIIDVEIPDSAIIKNAIHQDEVITKTKRTQFVYETIIKLTETLVDEHISLQAGI